MNLDRLEPISLTGSERLLSGGRPLERTLLDFWRWSTSDLVNNATRGVFAEFLVATALGISVESPREVWAPWDLTTPEGIRVEVKSAAYIQSWNQRRLSPITFNIAPTQAWDSTAMGQRTGAKRQSDAYVFALLAHQEKATIDPLNLDQWEFFVLPARTLDSHVQDQQTLSLGSLVRLHGPAVPFAEIKAAVLSAVAT